VKKLISIGVALALVAMVVLPLGVTASGLGNYTTPTTYAKIPFSIVESGIMMVGLLLDAVGGTLGMPGWLNSTTLDVVAEWAGGPLAWSVDMLAWGLDLVGEVVGALDPIITAMNVTLPLNLTLVVDLFEVMACKLLMPWNPVAGNMTFSPCP
jgi:hypothetical protein